jgi:CheY-like chemotaxis protein
MNTFDNQTVLLVEDSEDDRFIFSRAFKRAGGTNPVQTVTDGRAAVDYLSGQGVYADRALYPDPAVIFLDLKLPRLNGLEVLEWMRGREGFSARPVIVLTSSAESRDIGRTRELGARSYLVKPPDPAMLARVLAGLRTNAVPEIYPA